MSGFIISILAITGLIHWFLYTRLTGALGITSTPTLWLLRLLALYLALSYIVARLWERIAPEPIVIGWHVIASVWLGLMWQLLWMCVFIYLIKLILLISGAWATLSPYHVVINRSLVVAVSSVAVGLCTYGVFEALGNPRIIHLQIPVKNITPELRDLRILMASDIHAGVLVGPRHVQRIVSQIMAQKPDLILLPGDMVDRSAEDLKPIAAVLKQLRAPLGVYGSTGNHEYYVGLTSSIEFYRQAGIYLLANKYVKLPGGLLVAGIDDRTARQFHLPRPSIKDLIGSEAEVHPAILLNHTPAAGEALEADAAGVDLVLSGHTHGGQIWPFSEITRRVYRFHHGLYKMEKGHIFVSCGLGYWGPPIRIGRPPEIAVIRLVGETEPARIVRN